MKLLRVLALAALALASWNAVARSVVPIVNYENVPTRSAGVTEAQVRQAIETAARSQQWDIREVAPGRMVATLSVRNKHTVVTDIEYSATTYSVKYRDSVNMKYEPADNAPGLIHPFYNRWVGDLKSAIGIAIDKS
ncbi:hypothetical protein [Xylophilus sp. GOD-11R]|uniref:hypothetical protein n=1 Tax=Xylophilus sp. GOD-11R TaxID=3089814 RepID=UPI00298D36C1|nr:hypothetical protein [Xylophilus sp. GOD-11R]WPB57088.1 hypothetical protein R9X41_00020 [Xylophilus sp. GOD-11R]